MHTVSTIFDLCCVQMERVEFRNCQQSRSATINAQSCHPCGVYHRQSALEQASKRMVKQCWQLRNSTRSICTQHKSKLVDTVCICWDNEWSAHFFRQLPNVFRWNFFKTWKKPKWRNRRVLAYEKMWSMHWGRSLLVQLIRLSPDGNNKRPFRPHERLEGLEPQN